jgi:hypothetical protein
MEELLRTNDVVLISFVESLLKEAGLEYLVADRNMSIVEGSLGVLRQRILVNADHLGEARQILSDAGLAGELAKVKSPE